MLTNTKIKNAKAKSKSYTLRDGQGLFLEITTKGQKLRAIPCQQFPIHTIKLTIETH